MKTQSTNRVGKHLDRGLTLLAEDMLSLSESAQILGVHPATAYRYASRGIRGTRLETLRIGGKLLTSRQAVTRFLSKTQ